MWRFYHEITQVTDTVVSQIPAEPVIFIIMGVITAVIVLSPSFFERKQK